MSTPPATKLDVHHDSVGGVIHVGSAHITIRRQQVTTAFSYSDGYLARRDAVAISPDLPLSTGSAVTSGLPGAFGDSAPDRWGQNLIRKRIMATRADAGVPAFVSDVDFLLGVADVTRQGALRFTRPGSAEFLDTGHDVPKLIQLPALLNAADLVARDDLDDLAAVKVLLDAGSGSLGGARPKASVVDEGRLLIAKFPRPRDEWNVMAWEKTALDLAERCGFLTPSRRLVDVSGRPVLLLDRFDRGDGARIPYVSAMTLVGSSDGEVSDYLEVAEALADHGSNVTLDLQQLWCRVAFSIAINNTDDHLRNHGFLYRRGGWTLAPIFDVNPNPESGVLRATTINFRSSADPAAEFESLLAVAAHFGYTAAEAQAALAGIVGVVRAEWRAVAGLNGVTEAELRRFAPTFDR